MAQCFPQFPHNYNQVSREVMYNWFNKHLKLGQPEPVVEKPFVPVPPRELSVYRRRPSAAEGFCGRLKLRRTLTNLAEQQLATLRPTTPETWRAFQHTVRVRCA